MRRYRNARYAPESLERKLNPSGVGVTLPPADISSSVTTDATGDAVITVDATATSNDPTAIVSTPTVSMDPSTSPTDLTNLPTAPMVAPTAPTDLTNLPTAPMVAPTAPTDLTNLPTAPMVAPTAPTDLTNLPTAPMVAPTDPTMIIANPAMNVSTGTTITVDYTPAVAPSMTGGDLLPYTVPSGDLLVTDDGDILPPPGEGTAPILPPLIPTGPVGPA